jgi:NADH:ubiquinone oxidoreductase subunit F (NADH-binding)
VAYPAKRSIFDIMFGQAVESTIESRLGGVLKGWQIRLWSRGGMMRLMPYTIEVR